jgi:oligosaccharide repeat unit polymerase
MVNKRYISYIISLIVFFLSIYLYYVAPKQINANYTSIILVLSTLVLYAIYKLADSNFWSARVIYAVVFYLFHFGFLFLVSLNIYEDFEIFQTRWLYNTYFSSSQALCLLGLSSYALAAFTKRKTKIIDYSFKEKKYNLVFIRAFALVFLVGGIVAWFAGFIVIGGIGALTMNYTQYLQIGEKFGIATYLNWMIGTGLSICAATKDKKIIKICMSVFLFWAAFAFPMGLRGEVLFPLTAFIIIHAKTYKLIKPRYIILGAVLLLSFISFVRETRHGAQKLELGKALNPLYGLAELGASIRPAIFVQAWYYDEQMPLYYGQTLYGPLERFVISVTPFASNIDARKDTRLMNVVVQDKEGPIGFSPIAEGFINGHIFGVIIVMWILGWLMKWIDRSPNTIVRNLYISTFLYIAITIIRNAFTQIPSQVIMAYLMVSILVFVLKRQAT